MFDPGPTATITGTARVGETLIAGEGSASPTPDDYDYQWYENGTAIGGATSKTFTLTSAQAGKHITVMGPRSRLATPTHPTPLTRPRRSGH